MSYYEKNMECMKISCKNFYTLLIEKNSQAIVNINKLDQIRTKGAKNGEQILIIHHNSIEYRLNSIYRPSDEAMKWAEQYNLQNLNNVIAMFGLGNGIFVRALMERMGAEDTIIIYEPCYEIFQYVLQNYDITDILKDQRVVLTVEGINDSAFHIVLNNTVNINNIKTQIQCCYPNYDKIFQESCLRFYKEIKDSYISAQVNVSTMIFFGGKHIENTMNNLSFIKDSSTLPIIKKNIPEGIPAVVVAAGPSVRDNIELLKKLKGRAVIFAVDRILDYLLDAGVIPDFVVSVDAVKDIKFFSYRDNITIPLICYYESNHDILVHHKGKKILCTSNMFTEEIYRRTNKESASLLTSGSVALVAYGACVELGFQRIILVGQDLAYNEGRSHAGEFIDEEDETKDVFVEGIDGNQIKSRYDWKEYVLRYQDLILLNKEVEVIDAKQKGAKIKGAINMSLTEAYERYCNRTYDTDTFRNINDSVFSQEDLTIIKDYLDSSLASLKKIREKAKDASQECDKLLKYENMAIKPNSFDKSLKKLSKLNKSIDNNSVIYSLLNHYVTAKTADSQYDILLFTDDEHANNVSTFTKSKQIYQAVIEVADYARERLEAVFKFNIM